MIAIPGRRRSVDGASHGLVVRDARRRRAPHHEGQRPHPEEARSAVSKDEATELENALVPLVFPKFV
jgi:hypothetical protein